MPYVVGAVRFTASKLGKTGLTVTGMVDVYRVAKDLSSHDVVVTDGNAIEIGQGLYGYAYSAANTTSYIYYAVFTTDDATVDDKQPVVWLADPAEQTVLTSAIAGRAAPGDEMALTAAAVDAILDEVVEGSYTLRQMIRVALAALAAKCSGGGTTTITFRDLNDREDRIVATVDANGNRTAVTVTAT